MNKGVANFAYGTYCYCLTCLFNSRRLSWMFKMDWNTGLSRTEIRALRSAPTCRLFLRSSVWRTLVCTSLRSSRAARVSLEIGILIISGSPAKTKHGPRLLLGSSTWADRCPWCCFSPLLLSGFLVHHSFTAVDCFCLAGGLADCSLCLWQLQATAIAAPNSTDSTFLCLLQKFSGVKLKQKKNLWNNSIVYLRHSIVLLIWRFFCKTKYVNTIWMNCHFALEKIVRVKARKGE